ncbi:GMC family oxidoreductase [Maricurvus nonylphenolicus]
MENKQFDLADDSVVVVIGSGAGGGTLSNELAQKGIRVVCLEAGNHMSLADVENDPVLMNQRMGWLDKRLGSSTWNCKTVGGTTMRWSGIAARFAEHEFRARTTYGELEGTSLIDWPINLQELEPYYARAEDKMSVSGTNGQPASFPHSNYKVMAAGARKIGYTHITHQGMAINSAPRDGRPPCMQIGFCFSGCKIGAKWSTLYTEIPKAQATGNFELRAGCRVLQVLHNNAGKVTGVIYADAEGNIQEQKARAVAVAGNAVETARLLQHSASALFPQGLGNHSGHLGRNYMRHVMTFAMGVMPGEVNFHRGARQTGHIEDELHHDASRGFAGGYYIEPIASDPVTLRSIGKGIAAPWGEEAAEMMENYKYLAGLNISGEDPPQLSNAIELHATEKDQFGVPIPMVKYNLHDNSIAMQRHGNRQMKRILEAVGAKKFWSSTGEGAGSHNMGVARMSAKPKDGVTNRWGQVHEIPNLFVSDGSLFSTSAAANPTLTIVALAIRQAEHIAERMTRREL